MIKRPQLSQIAITSVMLTTCAVFAEEKVIDPFDNPPQPTPEPEENSPFSAQTETPADYGLEVDRTRGILSLSSKDGKYMEGSHFANWHWTADTPRWGRYFVSLRYTSAVPKLGVNLKIGDSVVKSYAPRSGGIEEEHSIILGKVYIPKAGEHPVTLLTGDLSNGPSFFVKGIDFIPAPENDEGRNQGIDGSITLDAATATTYASKMRYEPKPEKNCLGFWGDENDWAEWTFDVSQPGMFTVEVTQGCGPGSGGSEVAVLVNDQTLNFTVEETGGFQNWKTRDIGTVELKLKGENKIAILPQKKTGKAVMDIQKVTLTPVN